jgi:hypothetical protein
VLKAGETFFVDGAEYDVAAIYILANPDGQGPEFKYITIRNPIPKCECVTECNNTDAASVDGGPCCEEWNYEGCEVRINDISVIKKAVKPFPYDHIWVLPPFNHDHDRVDDVNIPDYIQGDPNDEVFPDTQWPDNPGPDLHPAADTIEERILEDELKLKMYWFPELKEERFDTNLLEEKFTELDPTPGGSNVEEWRWINIETMPWDYTEFHLPDIGDLLEDEDIDDDGDLDMDDARWWYGDYILVSSLMTEDSFVACKPADITFARANPATAQENQPIDFTSLTTGDLPIERTWDFNGLGTATGRTATFAFDEPGNYLVTFEAVNECGQDTRLVRVTVEACPGDFNDDDFRDTTDIGMMVPKWNTSVGDPEYDPLYDLDGDGDIDLADIMQVVALWMTPCPYQK